MPPPLWFGGLFYKCSIFEQILYAKNTNEALVFPYIQVILPHPRLQFGGLFYKCSVFEQILYAKNTNEALVFPDIQVILPQGFFS